MDDTRIVEWMLWDVVSELHQLAENELRRFVVPLAEWINRLVSSPMPADWRDRLGEYLDWWDGEGFEVAPQHRRVLETWIEDWARARGVLPVAALDETYDPETFAGLGSPRGGFDFILSQMPPTPSGMQIIEMLARDRRETIPEAQPRKVVRVDTHLGIGAWYDEAIASGQYDPGFLARTAVAIVRPLFPDSEPTKIITYDDGTVEIILGGGPASGALGAQAAELASLGGAAKAGRLLKELTETGFDVGVQEATGFPVGPSTIKSRRPNKPKGAKTKNPGGRLGSPETRAHVRDVADTLEDRGWTVTRGGGRPEEYIAGRAGRKGSAYPDITATKDGKTIRINTVDTLADSATPTRREKRAAAKIRRLKSDDHLLLIPKPKH